MRNSSCVKVMFLHLSMILFTSGGGGRRVCVAGEMATAADGTQSTGMHSCLYFFLRLNFGDLKSHSESESVSVNKVVENTPALGCVYAKRMRKRKFFSDYCHHEISNSALKVSIRKRCYFRFCSV